MSSLTFRLTKIGETEKNLLDERKNNYLMSKRYQRTHKNWNYVEHLLISVSAVTGWVSISAFYSIVSVPVGITSTAVGIKSCLVTEQNKKL